MNFDYILNAKPKNEQLKALYQALYKNIEKAENLYWNEPQKCGMLLRRAAKKICQIYNCYYEIGFAENALLEDYLCYTEDDTHNVLVSRFLSSVRQEQRDRLEWLRVWGDECIFMEENPEEIANCDDKLYLNVKKMMTHMIDATREMCERLNGMKDLADRVFDEKILPGYLTEEERMELEEKRKKEEKWRVFSFFKKK